jgi:hypothetical protein
VVLLDQDVDLDSWALRQTPQGCATEWPVDRPAISDCDIRDAAMSKELLFLER